MKRALAPRKLFRPNATDDCARFDGRTVEFLFDCEGKLLLLTGEFVVHTEHDNQCVNIHYAGRLAPHDPPFSDYLFRLSRAHLRSAVAATRPGSKADFLLEKPLLAAGCAKLELWKEKVAESVQ